MQTSQWHTRIPSLKEVESFEKLLDFHTLTLQWMEDIYASQFLDSHSIRRIELEEVNDMVLFLNRLTDAAVPERLDELFPDLNTTEVLKKIKLGVLTAQPWLLRKFYERVSVNEKSAFMQQLELSSFTAGRKCSEKRWPQIHKASSHDLNDDLRVVWNTLRNSPFFLNGSDRPFLIERATRSRLELKLLQCPHRLLPNDPSDIKDDLCHLHSFWLRGFVYSINSEVRIEHFCGEDDTLCQQIWSMDEFRGLET